MHVVRDVEDAQFLGGIRDIEHPPASSLGRQEVSLNIEHY